ncbi:TRAP transporter small permease subunit [Nitratireductor sp. CAU 1489]|uniref:TRAP transporter small permease protein n=1 Tax=Nitratireductor arenosus TaxID=2682096 RepID=A0A844QG38_9HYPH|nr:TRAP transporter small permease [Nitratireductor arenosus]MVA96951.1 TRAP transporter small permease subunit [Nitratireductor arenosus]
MGIGARLGRGFDRLLDCLALLGCALIMFQVISVSLEVTARYFLGISFGWVTSLNEWSLVFLTFLGAAWLQREGGHTSDDSIIQMFPAPIRLIARYVAWALALITCGVLTWYGVRVTWQNYLSNAYDFFKIREVPLFYIYAVIPFGGFLWLIQVLRSILQAHSGKRDDDPQNPSDM